MTQDNMKRIRAAYHSLRGLRELLESERQKKRYVIRAETFGSIREELTELAVVRPDLVPAFDEQAIRWVDQGYTEYYIQPLVAHLGRVIARLDVELAAAETSPAIQGREFSFVSDSDLLSILERDYVELQRAHIAQCWKSVILLAGGMLEALLLDALQDPARDAKNAKSAPGKQDDLTKWDLSSLIEVAVELNVVTPSVERLSHSVRQYRNLIHPGNQLRSNLTFGAEEARIALEVVHIVHRDLSKA